MKKVSYLLPPVDTNGIIDSSYYFVAPAQLTRYYDGVILPNGKSLFSVFKTFEGIRFVQFNIDGTPDSTFLSNDSIIATLSTYRIYHMAMQNDGKILTVGRFSYTANDQFSVFRFKRDFTLSIEDLVSNLPNDFLVWQRGSNLVFSFKNQQKADIRKIKIYDLQGRRLIEFVSTQLNEEVKELVIPIKDDMIKGVYFVTIETGDRKYFTCKIFIQ